MIGRLRGILLSKQPPWIVLEVGGGRLRVGSADVYDVRIT